MKQGVRGRVVAITGGAQGIGAAIAAAVAERGGLVAIGDLDSDRAIATAHALGTRAVGHQLDVRSTESFRAFLDEVSAQLGPPDVLVNNAGVMWVGPWQDESEAIALRQFDVNLHGVIRGMKLALPGMIARGRGHVINIASAASLVAPAGEATYTATKHAVYGYSKAVREEIRGTGVQLSVVIPAVVDTELAAGTSSGRTRRLTPESVATAVVATIERPAFEVYIPRALRTYLGAAGLLPVRWRDRVWRATVPDQVRSADRSARRAYESRVFAQRDQRDGTDEPR